MLLAGSSVGTLHGQLVAFVSIPARQTARIINKMI